MKLRSLRARLQGYLLLVLFCGFLPLAALSYYTIIDELNELGDARLAQTAHILQTLLQHSGSIDSGPLEAAAALPVTGEQYDSEIGFQVIDAAGHIRLASANFTDPVIRHPVTDRFSDLDLSDHRWRVFSLQDSQKALWFFVGERYDSRDDIVHQIILEHVLPLLLGLLALASLSGFAIRRGMAPLDALAALLRSRGPHSRVRLELPGAPDELRPMLDALNALLDRIEGALERERHFSADVSHELRTPLAAALLHLDNALADPVQARRATQSASASLQRLQRKIEQLLHLARLETGAALAEFRPVVLKDCVTEAVNELFALFVERGVELNIDIDAQPLSVMGQSAALIALIRNLLENALRHVPANSGAVNLRVQRAGHEAVLTVADNGPGLPQAQRAALFERFQRGPGSLGDGYGLGLSIVQRVSELHRGSIELGESEPGVGLRVSLRFPLVQASVETALCGPLEPERR